LGQPNNFLALADLVTAADVPAGIGLPLNTTAFALIAPAVP
jgi:hypothetical protein